MHIYALWNMQTNNKNNKKKESKRWATNVTLLNRQRFSISVCVRSANALFGWLPMLSNVLQIISIKSNEKLEYQQQVLQHFTMKRLPYSQTAFNLTFRMHTGKQDYSILNHLCRIVSHSMSSLIINAIERFSIQKCYS